MTAPEKCPRCNGTGRVWFDDAQLSDMKYQAKCPDCEGKAPKIVAPEKCPKCPDCGAPKLTKYDGQTLFGFRESPCRLFDDEGDPGPRLAGCYERERDALRAANAELEARVVSLEEDIAELREENCSMSHTIEVDDAEKIAELEARLAASVPRDVALNAAGFMIEECRECDGTGLVVNEYEEDTCYDCGGRKHVASGMSSSNALSVAEGEAAP